MQLGRALLFDGRVVGLAHFNSMGSKPETGIVGAPSPLANASRTRRRRDVPRLAFNQQEAAEALGISVDHFERHVKADLPVVYAGSLRLYPRKMLEQWLDERVDRGGRRVA